jgi:Xaa-Pro aminopeptidase
MKMREFQQKLREMGIDAAILYNMETNEENVNMHYLAGYKGYGFLVVPAKKRPFLVAPLMDIEYALKSKMRFYIMKKDFMQKISKRIGKAGKIGVDARKFSIFASKKFGKFLGKAQFVDIGQAIEELRLTKTEKEIEIIKDASLMTNRILISCINSFGKFSTERDIYNFLRIECIKNNVEPSFDFVVASGRNPATPHHIPNDKPLRKGFCVIDFGIRYKGYCTDITRTVYIGKPSKKETEIYNLVLDVQKKAIERVRVGGKYWEIEKLAREDFGKYEKKFIHSIGHSVGMSVHDSTTAMSSKDVTIKDGMYFTIEPGLYFPLRFGIRIEDDILVENGKIANLTKVPKELLSVKPKPFK